MQVRDVMHTDVITIQPETEIKEIARTLFEHRISGVPVINSGQKLLGIVTEGDLLHKETNPRTPQVFGFLGALIYYRDSVTQYDSDLKKLIALTASEIMTREVLTIPKDATIEEAASIMLNNNVKRLPVVENEKLIGIISRIDIIKTLIEDS